MVHSKSSINFSYHCLFVQLILLSRSGCKLLTLKDIQQAPRVHRSTELKRSLVKAEKDLSSFECDFICIYIHSFFMCMFVFNICISEVLILH